MTHRCHNIGFRVYIQSVNMYIVQCGSKQQKRKEEKPSTKSSNNDGERKRDGPNGSFGLRRHGKREVVGYRAFCSAWRSAMTAGEFSR